MSDPISKVVAQSPPIDAVREEAARCAEETARWQRGERGPLRMPNGLVNGEFCDAAFGVAAEVAMVVAAALKANGKRFRMVDRGPDAAQRLAARPSARRVRGRKEAAIVTRFTADDLDRANDAWGCNCGPGSVAAICGLTLDEVRPLFAAAGFDAKRYTNPTMMFEVLNAVGKPWQLSRVAAHVPRWGLCRIQWHGPWTHADANPRWAYRYAHWIGAAIRRSDDVIGVFDVNAMRSTETGQGWTSLADWEARIRPVITAEIRRASGGWHITPAIEVGL